MSLTLPSTAIDWNREPDVKTLHDAYSLLVTQTAVAKARLEELAERGSIASMWYLAELHAHGKLVTKDFKKAIYWFQRAEALGWIPAAYLLGKVNIEAGDFKSAVDALRRGVDLGYAPAAYKLGSMYKNGSGIRKDTEQAMTYLSIANSQEHLFAKRDLALIYISGGRGVGKRLHGLFMLLSLTWKLVTITIRRDFRQPSFQRRVT
jgi:TPR repeat protein